jgi:hypothetical protein
MCIYIIVESVTTIEGNVNKSSWDRRRPTGCSRDIMHKARGDHLDLATQIIHEVIMQGRLFLLIGGQMYQN